MTDLFDEIGSGVGTIYRPRELAYNGAVSPQNAPNKARQLFEEDYGVDYSNSRAKLTKFEGEKVVVVAAVDEESDDVQCEICDVLVEADQIAQHHFREHPYDHYDPSWYESSEQQQ